jgi:hypothetical protein
MKIKGSQSRPRIELVKAEHPLTAISDRSDVHANHNEAQNAALRRRASAYQRRQDLAAKLVEGLQRVLAEDLGLNRSSIYLMMDTATLDRRPDPNL